jgi:demethylmenaquinone methyltransferase/2-methoxy-6-polyprenyl-1,4-benzoquinol methylase
LSGSGALDRVDDEVLAEQLAYYRARVDEYDAWFTRTGRYDRGEVATATWRAETEVVRGWLRAIELRGRDVLELAPGTGLWTTQLLDAGAAVTAVDAAPEMLDALRAQDLGPRLALVQADLFVWRPPRRFDAVVACFFMSHVPDERFDAFCGLLAASLRDGGTVFLVDSIRTPTSTAVDHVLPDPSSQTMVRRLDDGRTFRVVKRFREDDELVAACASAGITASVQRTATYFQVVVGQRDG